MAGNITDERENWGKNREIWHLYDVDRFVDGVRAGFGGRIVGKQGGMRPRFRDALTLLSRSFTEAR